MRRALTALPVLAIALMACSPAGGGTSSAAAAGPALLDSAGGSFQPKLSSALDLDSASAATPANAADTKTALRRGGFSGGEERVFTQGDEFVTVLAVSLTTEVDAAEFVDFERGELKAMPAAVVYDDAAIPGSVAFGLSGQTRSGGRQVFCQAVWFAVQSTAYGVTDCAGLPRYPDLVLSLALRQYHAAGGGS